MNRLGLPVDYIEIFFHFQPFENVNEFELDLLEEEICTCHSFLALWLVQFLVSSPPCPC